MTDRPVVFDTNVLVAELAFPDEPTACVSLAESGAVEAASSPALLREFAAVLASDHFPVSSEDGRSAVERVADVARVVEPAVAVDAAADDDDDAVLECALTVGADSIISDDHHLRNLDGFAGIEVVTRETFLGRCSSFDPPADVDRPSSPGRSPVPDGSSATDAGAANRNPER